MPVKAAAAYEVVLQSGIVVARDEESGLPPACKKDY
jgi:hypothetical protein